MIKNTLEKIENSIQKIKTKNQNDKKKLMNLVKQLKLEIGNLSKTHSEHAESIAGFTAVAAHETVRSEKSVDLQRLALEGMSGSVKGFEASHPQLVSTVNEICVLLSGIGI